MRKHTRCCSLRTSMINFGGGSSCRIMGVLFLRVLDLQTFFFLVWNPQASAPIIIIIMFFESNFTSGCPTQSMMYVPLQVNRCQKYILLIVEYKYVRSYSGDFYFQESDPPHKIMRYWVYYLTHLYFEFPDDRICQSEMICIGGVPVLKRHFGRACP